jgi:hypothetical protein
MWADWLRGYIPREMAEHYTASHTFVPGKPERLLKHRTGDPHSIRIKCVCRKCNNDWISELQENAKPYLVPMLEGTKITLAAKGQRAIATWAAMMIMVSEHMDKDEEMVATPPSDRRWFYENRRPPASRWRIWIGQHRRETHELFIHNVMPLGTEEEIKRLGAKTPASPNTQTSTICLGQNLVIHAMGFHRVWGFIRRIKLSPEVSPVMRQIWPIQSTVIWPTSQLALNDAGLELLSMQWFEEMRLLTRAEGRSS